MSPHARRGHVASENEGGQGFEETARQAVQEAAVLGVTRPGAAR